MLSHIQVLAQRKRRAADLTIAVPTAVRVEAGWDRTVARWALANQLRVRDDELGTTNADVAATIRTQTAVSVPDAHLGAVIRSTGSERITVLTSDPGDVRRVAGTRPAIVAAL